jgi:uncharacterized membrane protein HdeD (DUF308 family)
MQRQFDIFVGEAPDVLAVHWGWVIALGIAIALLGLVVLWRARTATLVYVGLLGALLLVGAVAIFVFAFSLAGYWTDFFVHVLWAALLGIVGLILLTRPAISAEAITLMIALYLIVQGCIGIGFAFAAHVEALSLHIVEGLASIMLGGLLLAGWPFSGIWAIGLFLGVDLVLKGGAIAALGLQLRAISE